MTDFLQEGLLKLKIDAERIPELHQKIEQYIKELRLFNSAYNLVNTDDHDQIVIHHILDSLAGLEKIKALAEGISARNGKILIADIGAGGGLPGIPLALVMPEYDFEFVERMSKRCAFLENCTAILGLKNAVVKNIEAEKVPRESVNIAVFRAFRPLDKKMANTLLTLLAKNGALVAYKAKKEKIIEEMTGIKDIIPDYSVENVFVPFLTDSGSKENRERNLVVVRKIL